MAGKRAYKPTPPTGLSAHGRSVWTRTTTALAAAGDIEKADYSAIERYVRAVEFARACWDHLDPASLRTRGSQGQPVADPLLEAAIKAERAAAEFAAALGLEPKARQTKNAGGRPQTRHVPRTKEPPQVSPVRLVK